WDPTPTWTQLPPVSTSGQLWYDHDVSVDPTNPNIVYLAESNLRKYDGTAWATVTGTIHVDIHNLVWVGTRLLLVSDGGVWSTTNGGSTWTDHNSNLQITQFYHGAISPTDPNFALGASQDNGTARWYGTNGWRLVRGGDGGGCAIASASRWAASSQNQAIQRTTNNGSTFADANGGLVGSTPFIGAIRKAWHNDDVFLAGTTALNKSIN